MVKLGVAVVHSRLAIVVIVAPVMGETVNSNAHHVLLIHAITQIHAVMEMEIVYHVFA
jgi:hypothetical protein